MNDNTVKDILNSWVKSARHQAVKISGGIKAWVTGHRALLASVLKGMVIFLIAAILLVTVGIYGLGWQNGLAKTVSYVIPYPAARVDGEWISYNSYIRTFEYNQVNIGAGSSTVSQQDLSRHTMALLVSQEIIERVADERDVSLSDEEAERHYRAAMARNPAASRDDGNGIDQGIMRRQAELSLLAYKLELALRESGELSEDVTWNDWLARASEDRSIHYLLPQHSR